MHKALARTRTSSAAVLLAVVLAVDVLVALTDLPRAALGVADEVAHLSTAVLLLRVAAARWPLARPLPPTLLVAALAASVLIDVDHVPADVFGSDVLTEGTKRPYTHSLSTVGVLALAAVVARPGTARQVLGGPSASRCTSAAIWRPVVWRWSGPRPPRWSQSPTSCTPSPWSRGC